jgi:hypothetical protein
MSSARLLCSMASAAALLALSSEAAAAESQRADDWVPELSLRASLLLGERANRLDEVDAELERNGYASTPKAQRVAGLELGATYRRLRLEISVVGSVGDGIESRTTGQSLRVHRGWVSPELGYDVYRHRSFAVFPLVGYAAGDLLVDVDCQHPPLFAGYFSPGTCSRNLRRSFDALKLALGVENVIPLGRFESTELGFTFGTRIGYVWQLGEGAWRTGDVSEQELPGGPSADVGGPFMLLSLGLAISKP